MQRVLSTTLSIAIAIGASTVDAQSAGANVPPTAPLERQFAGDLTVLHDKVLALARAIPAEKILGARDPTCGPFRRF